MILREIAPTFERDGAISFCVIGNFPPMTEKTLRGMRTRAKKKHVASDRARRENVPWHILSYCKKYVSLR